jgi:hypothetical protein
MLRSILIGEGTAIDRPQPKSGDASESLTNWQQKIERLVVRLTQDIPVEKVDRSIEQQSKWLLAFILDWHRRENKAVWWEYFRLRDLTVDDLLDERAALSGLTFVATVGGTPKVPVHRFSFPAQDTDIRGGEDLRSNGGDKVGKVDFISLDDRTVDIKKTQATASFHPAAVFAHQLVPTQVLADALVRIGEYVADHGITGDGPFQAARDLLMTVNPRVGGQALRFPEETTLAAATRIAPALQGGVFPIQPPGAGKTHVGARMISALARENKSVGVTANSHKVIRNILDEVLKAAAETGIPMQCIQKVKKKEVNLPYLQFTIDNAAVFAAIGTNCQVGAGTAWLWACPDATESVDVLFIDEAAQMLLADVLAASQAAKSIVLLGDPRQLEQPMQGTHPEGVDASALDHILGTHATISPDRGLFLEETWRLHPDICAFTSEMF